MNQFSSSRNSTLKASRLGTVACILACLGAGLLVGCGKKSTTPNVVKTQPDEPRARTPKEDFAPVEPAQDLTLDRDAMISKSESLEEAGELGLSANVLRQLLVADPTDAEVVFRFASIQAARGNLDEAISLLDSIPLDHPEAGLAALGQAADWCFEMERYDDAETRYKKLVQAAPDAAMAHRQLAYLFNRQGRRHEAADHIRVLCRLGDIREDELHSLISLSDGVFESDPSEDARSLLPIGQSGHARVAFTTYHYREAAEILRDAVEAAPEKHSINAFYGRAIAEAQEEEWFLDWLNTTNESTTQHAEYWAALGTYLVEHQRFDESVRALAEALRRDPTDARSYRRINQALVALGKQNEAKKLFDRYVDLRSITLASNEIATNPSRDLNAFTTIADHLEKSDRSMEAILWRSIQAFYQKRPRAEIESLNEKRLTIARSENAFGSDQQRLCDLKLDTYPLPDLRSLLANRVPANQPTLKSKSLETPVFVNVAKETGLTHHYQVASTPQGNRFSIYQSLGGGVAVVDYDLDGWPDLYFAQGGNGPPSFIGNVSNELYRSVDGKLREVTTQADAIDSRYTIGVTAGDWNQDGLPDLVTGNLGQNQLFINQGDGTFTSHATDPLNDLTLMRSSIAIADVTGDSLPDIVELNYAHDDTITKQPELNAKGEVVVVGPLDFKPGTDQILINDGSGRPKPTPLNGDPTADATGLGIIITNFDQEPGNEIFVGNDMAPDRLWKRNDQGTWDDLAPTSGCALSSSGTTNASMGIAAADFDHNGLLDLHITNFENQSATLFLNRNGTFQDRAIQYRLARDSFPVLGFGCQPIDYDLDGNFDLVVSNGHVDDTGTAGQSFKQPPQLFANRLDHFKIATVEDSSGYFSTTHVGRALARLDFNQDGKSDLVVTHLEADSALLINKTQTKHHWLNLRLVGTLCERDAIGTKVELNIGDQRRVQWVIAGDGYLCHNETGLSFGLGDEIQVSEMVVTWPSGDQQTIERVPANQSLLVVQGEQEPFILGRSETRTR